MTAHPTGPGTVKTGPTMRRLPERVWTSHAMRQAIAEHPGRVIAVARVAHGLRQDQLGTLTSTSQAAISRMENGAASAYDLRMISLFGRVLGIPPRLLGLACYHPARPVTLQTQDDEPGDDMRRREFAVGLPAAFLGAELARMFPELTQTEGRVGRRNVDSVYRALDLLHSLDTQHGGDTLHETAASLLRRVEGWIGHGSYGPTVERSLHSAAGHVATSTGWFAYDAGQAVTARRYYTEGLHGARQADDAALEARACQHMSQHALWSGRFREAVSISRRGQALARGEGDLRLHSLLTVREGSGWAPLGETAKSERAFDRGRTLLARADDHGLPAPWTQFYTEAEVNGLAADAEAALGRLDKAVDLVTGTLDSLGDEFIRNRLYYMTSLMEYRQRQGDLEGACAAGREALNLLSSVGSGRSRAWLRSFHRAVVGKERDPVVAGFLHQYATVMA